MYLPEIEVVSAKVHEAWMRSKSAQGVASRKAEDGEELMAPYDGLSEKAKELDRGTVRAVYAAIHEAAKPQIRSGTPSVGEASAPDAQERSAEEDILHLRSALAEAKAEIERQFQKKYGYESPSLEAYIEDILEDRMQVWERLQAAERALAATKEAQG